MPNQPKSPILGVRLPPELKDWVERHAAQQGTNASALVRDLIAQYRADVEGVTRVATSAAT